MILKPLGPEVSIAAANTVTTVSNTQQQVLIRVINTGAAAVLHFANGGGEYANLTVSNVEFVVVQKAATDTLQGAGMLAVPVAYKF